MSNYKGLYKSVWENTYIPPNLRGVIDINFGQDGRPIISYTEEYQRALKIKKLKWKLKGNG